MRVQACEIWWNLRALAFLGPVIVWSWAGAGVAHHVINALEEQMEMIPLSRLSSVEHVSMIPFIVIQSKTNT